MNYDFCGKQRLLSLAQAREEIRGFLVFVVVVKVKKKHSLRNLSLLCTAIRFSFPSPIFHPYLTARTKKLRKSEDSYLYSHFAHHKLKKEKVRLPPSGKATDLLGHSILPVHFASPYIFVNILEIIKRPWNPRDARLKSLGHHLPSKQCK